MTTNAGARDASVRTVGFGNRGGEHKADAALDRTFSPEFRNRLDVDVDGADQPVLDIQALPPAKGKGKADRSAPEPAPAG
jgi:hypothetical protein